MKLGEHIGIVVLVNKYDGVDLPGEAREHDHARCAQPL
jgi:hypothetical protein